MKVSGNSQKNCPTPLEINDQLVFLYQSLTWFKARHILTKANLPTLYHLMNPYK